MCSDFGREIFVHSDLGTAKKVIGSLAQRLKSNMIPRNLLLTIRTDGGPYKKRIIQFKRMQPCMIRPLFHGSDILISDKNF